MTLDPGWLLASLLISCVGLALFLYGKKQQRWPQLVAGLVLIGYGYFVSSVAWMVGIGAAVLLALWGLVRLGW